ILTGRQEHVDESIILPQCKHVLRDENLEIGLIKTVKCGQSLCPRPDSLFGGLAGNSLLAERHADRCGRWQLARPSALRDCRKDSAEAYDRRTEKKGGSGSLQAPTSAQEYRGLVPTSLSSRTGRVPTISA